MSQARPYPDPDADDGSGHAWADGPEPGPTPPRGWSTGDAPTPPHGAAPEPRGVTETGSFVAPGSWTTPSGVPRAADRRARARRTAGRPTPPSGIPTARPDRLVRTRRRLVAVARVLAGGLVTLAVVVIVAPWLLGGPGPGSDTVLAHLLAAGGAVAATAVAANRRTGPLVAVLAAAAVPVILVVLFSLVWWA